MAIKAVLFDLDGTLIDSSGHLVPNINTLISGLDHRDIKWLVLSNQGRRRALQMLSNASLNPHLLITNDDVNERKPSPAFCKYAADKLDIELNEMIYVGDNDKTDAICAINAGVLYLNAGWSNKHNRYGLNIITPRNILSFIDTFLSRDRGWYIELNNNDRHGRPISVRGLYDATSVLNRELVRRARDAIKEMADLKRLRDSIYLFFLTTLYLDNIYQDIDWWVLYPSSGQTAPRHNLEIFISFASKLFKDRYKNDLLIRHTRSIKSAFARHRGEEPGFVRACPIHS
ncbi:MAG: HAD family hydrolase [Sedimentisphaerales bacterium]|nr:HAD family hydrolase [Sedimentisphaerales bacterium]